MAASRYQVSERAVLALRLSLSLMLGAKGAPL
jgi:hypothetical protein